MNLDENTGLFRESFKGFNKDDVAAFIQKLSKDYADNEEKYKEKIAALTNENNAKIQELKKISAVSANAGEAEAKLKKECARLSGQLNEKDDEIKTLSSLLNNANADADKYKDDANKLLSEVRSKDAEIIELKKSASMVEISDAETEQTIKEIQDANAGTVNELSAKIEEISGEKALQDILIAELKNQIEEKDMLIEDLESQVEENEVKVEEEQKIYENVASDLGVIVYSAKKTAEEMMAKAKSEAEDMLAKAKSEAEDIITRANIKKHATLQENERNTAQFKEKYEYIKSEHEKIMESFNNLSENYSANLLELAIAIESISNNI